MMIIGVFILIIILYLFLARKPQQQDLRDENDIIDIEGTVVDEDKENNNGKLYN